MTTTSARKCRALAAALALAPVAAAAAGPGSLENPAANQVVSGLGVISGWYCGARRIEASIDGGAAFVVPYGSSRGDTASACGGNAETGFAFLVGWDNLAAGPHSVRLTADGVEFARRTFTVVRLGGGQWITGRGPRATIVDWPRPGQSLVLDWQESTQSFEVSELRADAPTLKGRWNGADLERRSGCRAVQNDGNHGTYAQYQVDMNAGSFAMQQAGVTGLNCTYEGTYVQEAGGLRIGGTYACTDGKTGRFDSTRVAFAERSMSMDLAVKLEGSETCTIDKTLAGARY